MADASDLRPLSRLIDGMRALDAGQSGVARFRFEQVVAEGGERPALEVAHAWRGLAQLCARDGDLGTADAHLKHAVSVYRDVARLDPIYRARAQEGEAAALLLAAELLERRGQSEGGLRMLERAHEVLDSLGDERSAEGWATTGRIASRRTDRSGAEYAFREAIARYEEAGNHGGHAEMLLEISRLRQERGDNSGAERTLAHGATMARDGGRLELYARIQLGRGLLVDDRATARDCFLLARDAAVTVGDRSTAGLALLALGRQRWEDGEGPLLAGAQLLLDAGHFPGLALALLRLAEHGAAVGDVELAQIAAEGAWRVYRGVDPVDGLGRVLKVVIKVFAAQRLARPLLAGAFARAALVGGHLPQALQVRDHYARLAPLEIVEALGSMSREKLLDETRTHLQKQIVPTLQRFGLRASSFATAQGALDVLGVLAGSSPRAVARKYAPIAAEEPIHALPEPGEEEVAPVSATLAISMGIDRAEGPGGARSGVYDPTGRLAAWVSSSVDSRVLDDDDGAAGETGSFRKVSSLAGFGGVEEPIEDEKTEEILEDRGYAAFVAHRPAPEVKAVTTKRTKGAAKQPAAPIVPIEQDAGWSALLDDER